MIFHHFVQMIYFTINDGYLKVAGQLFRITDKKTGPGGPV